MLDLVVAKLAIEAQAFSLKMPEQFFGMFSPARSEGSAKAAKDRLEEDVRFVAKSVRDLHFHPPDFLQLTSHIFLLHYPYSHHMNSNHSYFPHKDSKRLHNPQ